MSVLAVGSNYFANHEDHSVKMEPAGHSYRQNEHLSQFHSQDLMQPQHRVPYTTHNHAHLLQTQSHMPQPESQHRPMPQYHSSIAYSHPQSAMPIYQTRMPETAYAVPTVASQTSEIPGPRLDQITLSMRQNPAESLVVSEGKEKCRKPIDPPPVVEITLSTEGDNQSHFLQNPYYFMVTTLVDATTGEDIVTENKKPILIGSTTSSLHRLKDAANKDGGFFVFGDLSCKKVGTYRMKFTLYELVGPSNSHGQPRRNKTQFTFIKECVSKDFKVVTAKEWRGLAESTSLSRAFSEQGCRLRLRKEPRNPAKNGKRSRDASDSGRAGPVQPAVPYGREASTNDHTEVKRLKRGRSELEDDTSGTYDHHYGNEHPQWRHSNIPYPHSYHSHSSVGISNSTQPLSVRVPAAPVLNTSIDSSLHTDSFSTSLNTQPPYGSFT